MKTTTALLITSVAGVCLFVGCAGQTYQPRKSGFLSHYHHMTKVDDTTSRYVNAPRLATYNKFKIVSVQVLTQSYNGKPITPEQQKRIADYLRSSITTALQDKYPVVDAPSTDTAEIRVAVTDAYKGGSQLGISIEGEIQDSFSGVQVAAVMRTELGKMYLGDWWDGPSAKQIIDGWSQRLRQAIDSSRTK
jgi:hypothetical protein